MPIENLGVPNLGPTSIPENERRAWPSHRLAAPSKIEFKSAESVTNEVYFRRSTAMERAQELLGSTIPYMAFHVGVSSNTTNYSTYGAGIVLVDDTASEDESAGLYFDFCNGQLIVEHIKDSTAQLKLVFQGMTKTLSTVGHYHVAAYGKDQTDPYAHLAFDDLYRKIYEDSAAGIHAQDQKLRSFGTGIREYLPTYFHVSRATAQLPGHNPATHATFGGLRVPAGLPARRTYEFKTGLPKHHIYYLNSPSSPYFLDDSSWR